MASPAGSNNSASIRKRAAPDNNNNNTGIDEEHTSSPNLMVENDVPPPARPFVTEIEINTNPFYKYGEQLVLQRGWGLPPYVCKEVIKTPTGLRAIAVRRRNVADEGSCITSVGGAISSAESISNKKNQP